MKRDEALAKQILANLTDHHEEFSSFNLNLPGYDPILVKFYITLMIEEKFIFSSGSGVDTAGNPGFYPFKIRITWKGWDYLEGKKIEDK